MSVPAWFARSVYRAQEAAMHRPTFAMLAEIERTQWLTRDGVEAYQAQRLNQLLQRRWRTAPGTPSASVRPVWSQRCGAAR
jgi:phenylacetate-CoA ligase